MWIASYTCCLFSCWALTFIAAPRPPATVANPHIVRSLHGSKEMHIQSHNRTRLLHLFGYPALAEQLQDHSRILHPATDWWRRPRRTWRPSVTQPWTGLQVASTSGDGYAEHWACHVHADNNGHNCTGLISRHSHCLSGSLWYCNVSKCSRFSQPIADFGGIGAIT